MDICSGLKDLYGRLLCGKDKSLLREKYLNYASQMSSPSDIELAYLALIEASLGLKTKPFQLLLTQKGAPLFKVGLDKNLVCHPKLGKELALIVKLLGTKLQDPALKYQGIQAARYIDTLIDQWNRPFPGFLLQEDEAPYLGAPLFLTTQKNVDEFKKPRNFYDPELGLVIKHIKGMSAAFSLTGMNTALATLMKEDVGILAFGPTKSGDFLFGVQMSPDELIDQRQDLPGHFFEGESHFGGWTKMVNPESLQHVWLEFSALIKQKLFLKIRFLELKEKGFVILMALKGNTLRVGDSIALEANTLKQYKGEALPIHLKGEKSEMKIALKEGSSMQVIPLARDHSYWGGDFLVAYSVDCYTHRLAWEIF